MKSINNFVLLLLTITPLFIFYSILKKELKQLQAQNIVISKTYYPLKSFHYKKMIEEVKKKNLKTHQKNLISGGSLRATFYLKPLSIPRPKNNTCKLSKKDLFWRIKINYTLPRWKSRHLADNNLKERWDKYLIKLINHEDKHRDIFLKGAEAIHSFIEKIPPQLLKEKGGNCIKYVGKIKQKIFFIFKKYEQKNFSFDLNSIFGLKDGLLL